MLKQNELSKTLKRCPQIPLRETLYRATRLSYLATLTSTEGAWKSANRYSAPNLSQALYLADGSDQAMLEATRQFQRDFVGPSPIPAYAIFPVKVNVDKILDLTNSGIRQMLHTGLMELTGDWRTAYENYKSDPIERVTTHKLGQAAFMAKWQGIRYPSAYDAKRWNLVLFTEHCSEDKRTPDLDAPVENAIRLLRLNS